MTALAAPRSNKRDSDLWRALTLVADPEIPVISIVDLGIVRFATTEADGTIRVGLSPTYSGCPATEVIRDSVRQTLREHGYPDVQLVEVLSPPWTSDWISPVGRQKLLDYGIAPPADSVSSPRRLLRGDLPIACPQCGSLETQRVSEFGSTPCKALYRCSACLEPFDYFKCI